MRDVPANIAAAWKDGEFIGDRRAIARVTVQHPTMFLRSYTMLSTFSYKKASKVKDIAPNTVVDPTKGMKVHQQYADFLFTGRDSHTTDVTAYLVGLYNAAGKPNLTALASEANVSRTVLSQALAGSKLLPLSVLTRIAAAIGGGDHATLSSLYASRSHLEIPLELPNIKSVAWTRSIDTDVADCTIECWNTKPLEIGETPRQDELDEPGYYTYDRGATSFGKARWGHVRNEFFGMLVPDNIIRTYEGYGHDPAAIPELDVNLVQTGTWLIDTVTTTDTGTLSIKCRDMGRILLDQQYYYPVVPDDFYDEDWENWSQTFPGEPITSKTRLKVTAQDSSNTPWVGFGHGVSGHTLGYAFDGDPNTYWLSIGNIAASKRFAYEWVQATVKNQTVSTVRIRTKKKNYTAYVSVMVGGVWQGSATIDYHRDGIGQNGANIAYSTSAQIDTEDFVEIALPKPVAKVQKIRITLGNLQDFHIPTYHYRAGIRDVEVYGLSKTTTPTKTYTVGPAGSNPDHYSDYTDIVKLLCAWGGFFWPDTGRQRISDGTYRTVAPLKFDTSVLGKGVRGRVWGDFQQSGTSGPAALTLDNFDKKALMDGIAYIRDILGFIFNIDETGACLWRQPNIHDYGCRWSAFSEQAGKYVKGYAHPIDENTVLMSLSSVIDSKNVREAYFVGDTLGKFGGFAPGFNPNPTGLRRIAGWTDQNFLSTAECERMADLLSLRQLFTYRTDHITIPANPAIQIDDQVRIFERTTAEGYVHYVQAISSSLDMTTGSWTYDIDTHWLGYDGPKAKWLFHINQFKPVTQKFIAEQAKFAERALEYTRKEAVNG